jgi:hypothetical protein
MMMTLLAASDCPSDCGWKAAVMCNLVPTKRISSRQNVDMKIGSRFDNGLRHPMKTDDVGEESLGDRLGGVRVSETRRSTGERAG